MNNRNGARDKKKFKIRSEISKKEKNELLESNSDNGRANEKYVVGIINGFFVISGVQKGEEFRSSLKES